MSQNPSTTSQIDRRPVICITDSESRADCGHYITHFCLYIRLFIEAGADVVALCPYPEAVRTELNAYGFSAEEFLFIGHINPHPGIRQPTRRGFRKLYRGAGLIRRWKRLATEIRNARKASDLRIDHVFLADLPSFSLFYKPSAARWIDLVFRTPWSAWSYDSSIYRHAGGVFEDPVLERIRPGYIHSKYFHAIFHIDEHLSLEMNQLFSPKVPFRYVPDIADHALPDRDPKLIREIKQAARQRKIIVLPGVQSRRKGLYIALQLAEKRPDLFFVFAGPLDPQDHPAGGLESIRTLIETPLENCFFHMHRLELEADLNAIISASDVVFAVYPGHLNSSGILIKSAFLKKPAIIADDAPLMKEYAEKYQIGFPVSSNNLSACSDAIDRAIASKNASPKYARLQHDFSEDRLKEVLHDFVSTIRQSSLASK
ncbi:MAG: hypothetical protein JEZ10_05575 [Verrucomicrobia bacterium]|nr:hypothetical protein [Verrucomicrobiota bacterium]